MQGGSQIAFEITTEQGQTHLIAFDKQILKFNIEYLNNNHHEPYPVPANIAKSVRPFQIMKQFLEIHQYNPATIKVVKPIASSNYAQVVDPLTFKVFQKYSDEKLMKDVEEVLILSKFLRFEQLTEAISAAAAVNFYISNDDKDLQEYKKKEGLESISSEEICQIIEIYEQVFRAIQYKAKQEFLKLAEQQPPRQ